MLMWVHGREHGKAMDVNMEKPDWEQYTQVIDSIDIFH